MLYVPICDGTNKVEKLKLKVCDEIKRENVSLISSSVGPTAHWDLNHMPSSGAPNPKWLAGPVTLRYIKRVGAAGSRHEVRCQPHTPHPHSLVRSTGSAASDGKLRRRRRHCVDRRCPSADLHLASLPKRKSPTWLADPAAPLPEMVHSPLPFYVRTCITFVHTHSHSFMPD
jgi:hypothetical protein